ncbi:unnamed protein product [Ixodes pacificus]
MEVHYRLFTPRLTARWKLCACRTNRPPHLLSCHHTSCT